MNKSEIKRRAEIMLAFADGKTIQFREPGTTRSQWRDDLAEDPAFMNDSFEFRVKPKGFRKDRPYNTMEEFCEWVKKEAAKGKYIVWSTWKERDLLRDMFNFAEPYSDGDETYVKAVRNGEYYMKWNLMLNHKTVNRWISIDDPSAKPKYEMSDKSFPMNVTELKRRYTPERALELSIEKWERLRLIENWDTIGREDIKVQTCALCEKYKKISCQVCPLKSCNRGSYWYQTNLWINDKSVKGRTAFMYHSGLLLGKMYSALEKFGGIK